MRHHKAKEIFRYGRTAGGSEMDRTQKINGMKWKNYLGNLNSRCTRGKIIQLKRKRKREKVIDKEKRQRQSNRI